MKGTLTKTKQGWVVKYILTVLSNTGVRTYFDRELPLHPNCQMEQEFRSDIIFDNRDGEKVEFEIVNDNIPLTPYFKTEYAKLINVNKLGNENVPKLGYNENKIDLKKLINGRLVSTKIINQDEIDKIESNALVIANEIWNLAMSIAKETLYEDEVKKVIFLARQKGDWQEYQYDFEEIIKSLKQPKQ